MRLPLSWYTATFEANGRKYLDIIARKSDTQYVWLWRLTEEQVFDMERYGSITFWDMVAHITKRHEEHACAAH